MSKIKKVTVTQEIYISSDGRETPVTEMNPQHLVNAYGRAIFDDDNETTGVLEREILRRIKVREEEQ